jgi:hypothetical protein
MVHHSIAVVITSFLTNFSEPRQHEVRRTPKFSGSRPVASRNGLLRFLARFVAKRPGYRRGPDQIALGCPSLGHWSPEIATANFVEFFFYEGR